MGQGKLEILSNLQKIICSALGREEVMSLGGVLFWKKCVKVIDRVVSRKDGSAFEAAHL